MLKSAKGPRKKLSDRQEVLSHSCEPEMRENKLSRRNLDATGPSTGRSTLDETHGESSKTSTASETSKTSARYDGDTAAEFIGDVGATRNPPRRIYNIGNSAHFDWWNFNRRRPFVRANAALKT